MFTKKLPRCASVAAVTTIAVPTVIGTIFKLACKSGEIVSSAKQVKKTIDNVKKMTMELTEQIENPSENITPDITEEVD